MSQQELLKKVILVLVTYNLSVTLSVADEGVRDERKLIGLNIIWNIHLFPLVMVV